MKFTKENVSSLFYDWRRNVISSADELHERILWLDDKPEKVAIPSFVAEWIERNKESEVSLQIMIKCYEVFYEDIKPGQRDNADQADGEKAVRWYVDNPYKFIQAYVNGYTIEKEPLYIVSMMDLGIGRIILIKNSLGYSFELESKNNGHWEVHFTEQQIKEYDKRYWAFAVPVEEMAK